MLSDDEDLVLYEDPDGDEHEVSLTEPIGDQYATTRKARRIKFAIIAEVELEVVEPPNVHNVEVKSIAKQRVFNTLSQLGIGVPTNINVEVRHARPDED
jgi:hypothetical protein